MGKQYKCGGGGGVGENTIEMWKRWLWRETRNVEKYKGRMESKRKLERASLPLYSRFARQESVNRNWKKLKAAGNRTCIITLMKFVCILFMR